VALPTFFTPFYSYEYDKRNIPETIKVEKNELMAVTGHLLDYMHGRRADLTVPSVVNGTPREFFNQREKDHMADVRAIFDSGFTVRNMAFWLLLLLLMVMAALKVRIPYVLARCCREVVVGFLLIAVILLVLIALDFDRAFNIFHLLFFTNDLWILNPATDLLINIVPLGFFMDLAAVIGILAACISLTVVLVSTSYLRHLSQIERYPEHG
jgi:integral membrane protein (TIGR01906 family)